MKRLFIFFAACLLLSLTAFGKDDKPLEYKDLPDLAQRILSQYYPGEEVTSLGRTDSKINKFYVVNLSDGTLLNFDKSGNWVLVEAPEGGEIPQRMVSGKILMYLSQNHPDVGVVYMEKDSHGYYKLTLADGTNLYFDNQFKPAKNKD